MNEEAIMAFTMPAMLFGVTAVITRAMTTTRKQKRKLQAQMDLHQRLLDKFGSAPEFVQFLQTEGGERLLGSLAEEPANPKQKILGSLQFGIIVFALGIAFYVLAWVLKSQPSDMHLHFFIFGTLALALGVGFVLSAGIAYRLSKAWKLINGEK